MKLYFKNLDGLRFVAAFMVFYHHCVLLIGEHTNIHVLPLHKFALHWGSFGVNLFFVLSSFLITSLLLHELKEYNTINFKNFYIRRSLRIWPLYFGYLLLGSAYILYSASFENLNQVLKNIFYASFFGINFQMIWDYDRSIIEILWSVCVEEHFYLLWPILIFLFRKKILLLCILVILSSLFCDVFFYTFPSIAGKDVSYLFSFCRFDLFALGALAAYFYFHYKEKIIPTLQNKYFQIIISSLFVLSSFFIFAFHNSKSPLEQFKEDILFGILFSIFILSLIILEKKIFLESKLFLFLGKISFGIYVFHPFVISKTITLLNKFFDEKLVVYLTPIFALLFTITIAYLSYEFFEKRFLILKNKYSLISKN